MHIFYSFIFVFSSRGKKDRSKDEAGNDVSELWKQKRNKTITSCQTRVQMVGAYFDLESGWGSAIKLKSNQKAKPLSGVSFSSNTMWTKFKISKFLLFRGGKEWKFWSELQTKFQKRTQNEIDTRSLSTVAALSVDPDRAYPTKRWEEFHLGLAEGGPIPSGFRPGLV